MTCVPVRPFGETMIKQIYQRWGPSFQEFDKGGVERVDLTYLCDESCFDIFDGMKDL